jgi:hypothetical protein
VFALDATVKEIRQEKDRFHAQAQLLIPADEDQIDQVELVLDTFSGRLYTEPLLNPKTGLHELTISGEGLAPFKVGDQILARCFATGEIPD